MKRIQFINKWTLGRILGMFLMMGLLLAWGASSAISEEADCSAAVELADVPLELKSRAAPGLISLVLENTRSLYYTIMVKEGVGTYAIDGTYYEHVFEEKTKAGSKYLETNTKRNYWQTQCPDFNTVFYDPGVTYVPWPRWNVLKDPKKPTDPLAVNPPLDANADPDKPRIWPLKIDTFDMNLEFSKVLTVAIPPPSPPAGSLNPWKTARYWISTTGPGAAVPMATVNQGNMTGWNFVSLRLSPIRRAGRDIIFLTKID